MLMPLLAILAIGIAGDTPFPASEAAHLELPGISSHAWESHPAIDPITGDLWFVRSDKDFSGWRILVSHCHEGNLSAPVAMPFAASGLEADPYFTADGTLYFISTRASGSTDNNALDIWVAHRDRLGTWQAPQRLPAPVNSDEAEWFPRPASDGWLYFGSRRPGGFGKDDIWRARQGVDGHWVVENVGAGLNTEGSEYEFQPSADNRWGILASDEGLFRVEAEDSGWRRDRKYGHGINAGRMQIGPLIAPDGHSFVFSRDDGDGNSGELFVARLDPATRWPHPCGGP